MKRLLRLVLGNRLRLLIGALSLVTILGTGTMGYVKGNSHASIQCAEKQSISILKGTVLYEKTKQDVLHLSPTALDKSLDEWMRD